jgi:gag-polypeptide of LTR copia-type
LDGTTARPDNPLTRPAGAGALTAEQVSAIKKHMKEINEYLQEQAIVSQQIASTILDSLYLKIKKRTTVKEAWDMLKADFEKRSCMIMIELQKRLQDT